MGSPFLLNLGDLKGAREYYGKAARIAEAMAATDPSDKQARIDLGIVLTRIGTVLQAPGEVAESLAALNRAAGILEPLYASETKNHSYSVQLSLLYEYRGQRLRQSGDDDGGTRQLPPFTGDLRENAGRSPRRSRRCCASNLLTMGLLPRCWPERGDREGAIRTAREAVSGAGTVRGRPHRFRPCIRSPVSRPGSEPSTKISPTGATPPPPIKKNSSPGKPSIPNWFRTTQARSEARRPL